MTTRAAERGVSLIEALVVLAVAALVMSMLIPEIGRGVSTDTARAASSQERAALQRAEQRFRAAVRFSARHPSASAGATAIIGDELSLSLAPMPRAGEAWTPERFQIERTAGRSALVWTHGAARETIAEWSGESAAFAFFSAGAWRSGPGPGQPEKIRLDLDPGRSWIENVPPAVITHRDTSTRDIEGGGNLDR